MPAKLSVIIPTWNEAASITATLLSLQYLRTTHEIIVTDGGSTDATLALSQNLADHVISSERGRAQQMNAGAAKACGEVFVFLHADTHLPDAAAQHILDGLALSRRSWGRFDVRLSGDHPLLRMVERLMNWRSRISGIASGDQAIFVRREWFEAVGGFPVIPLMEDVSLSQALKRLGPPLCLYARVITSSRRWEQHGILRTILLMWRLRLAYALGADPKRLAAKYFPAR